MTNMSEMSSEASTQLTCRTTPDSPRRKSGSEEGEVCGGKFGGLSDVFSEKDNDISRTIRKLNEETRENCVLKKEIEEFRPAIRWPDLVAQLFIHLGCLYGLFLCLWSAKLPTTLFGKSKKLVEININLVVPTQKFLIPENLKQEEHRKQSFKIRTKIVYFQIQK